MRECDQQTLGLVTPVQAEGRGEGLAVGMAGREEARWMAWPLGVKMPLAELGSPRGGAEIPF